jgi:urea transport system substrate-binding protein
MRISRRILAGLATATLAVSVTSCGGGSKSTVSYDDEITVGILHSLSGTMAISEKTLVDTEIMAIEEINAAGGVFVDGKFYEIKYKVEDGASNWPLFAEKSSQMIDAGYPVIFGGWTSASRKAMLPVYEEKDGFLYYPIQYEGRECSPNIMYTGATPNQQSEPATEFMYKSSPAAGKPFFLVGSDYVFPRTSNTITKEQLKTLGGEVVGEDYLPLGNTEVAPIITKIKEALPSGGVIINTLNGDQNVAFFKQIQDEGITPENGYYVMSYSIAEEEISTIGPEFLEGHYGAWNYMMSIDSLESQKFAAKFKKRWGSERVVADPQESAYNMVYLWKKAVEKAGTFDDEAVRAALIGVTFDAPQGPIEVMPNHHISQTVRIGQINAGGGFTILDEYTSDGPVVPQTWNQFYPEDIGFGCDWSEGGGGRKYKL